MKKVSSVVTATILSMSLLTVMAGAAIAPALDIIHQHFASSQLFLVQLIVSIPAIFIIITNLFFLPISRRFGSRIIAIAGLLLYIVSGAGCYFVDSVSAMLVMRALLGVSVGLIMPLSTGLLSYYFPPEEQARLMGLSAAMNQMGGVVATLLAGMLATIEWNDAFLVYLLGAVALFMVVRWLPDEHLGSSNKRGKAFHPRQLLKFHPSVVGMLLLMTIFFVFPTNFAIITSRQLGLSTIHITVIMVGLDVVAFFAGLVFGTLMKHFRKAIKYFAPLAFLAGYLCYAVAETIAPVIIGSVLIGLANGVGVPYLLTIASIKAGRNAATTVMPLLSAALYLGQFLSPILVVPLSRLLFGSACVEAPYFVAVLFSIVFLAQVFFTRQFQSLPPEK
ncbi:MAG: MFS transporter [Prevotella sp.]|nr:MFS transporter [Prevotella sp.]